MSNRLLLINRKIVSAKHLGAVEGDESGLSKYNDRTAAKASAHFCNEGGFVDEWDGVFRFSKSWTIKGRGGLIGVPGTCETWPPDFSGPHGTVFRHEGQGDFIVKDGAWHFVMSDIAFWPVYHKTSGAEIVTKNRAHFSRHERLFFNLPYRATHTENSVYTGYDECVVYSSFGDCQHYVSGNPAQSGVGHRNEKTRFLRCNTYTTQRHSQTPEVGTVKGDRTNGMVVAVGDYARFNGHWWQAIQSGTTGGSVPVMPPWTYSTDRNTIFVTDGATVIWGWYCRDGLAGVLVDSGGDYVKIRDCELLQGHHALKTVDTLTGHGPAKQIKFIDNEIDHTLAQAVYFTVGNTRIKVKDNEIESIPLSNGIQLAATCDQFHVTDNTLKACAGGGINNLAGTSASKIVRDNIVV